MRQYTILLIDYEPRSIESVRRPLAEAGFLVRLATDGVGGMAAFEEIKPDLVIIEAMIPKKHGFEVCQEIKRTAEGKRTPVFIQTAVYKGRKYRSQALHIHGCDEYLEKPFSDEFLLQAVRSRLGIAPGDVVRPFEPNLAPESTAPDIEVPGPDRPLRKQPLAVSSETAPVMPREPEHPAEEEITQKLDDLFALVGEESPSVHGQVRREFAVAATAVAPFPCDAHPPSSPVRSDRPRNTGTGELVSFQEHLAQRARSTGDVGARPDPTRSVRTEPRTTTPSTPYVTPPPRGLPVWVWAVLVGGVAVLGYLVFSGTI